MNNPYEPPRPGQSQRDELEARLARLTEENARLRQMVNQAYGAPADSPLDPAAFQRGLQRAMIMAAFPCILAWAAIPLVAMGAGSKSLPVTITVPEVGTIPLIDFAGLGTAHPGVAFGIIAFGGASIGVVAMGGMAIGIFATGGGAIGLIAVGGGAAGLIAVGGGAVGYIAMGGGAAGQYALGRTAYGRYALGLNRQDPEAITLFTRWFPKLRDALPDPDTPAASTGGHSSERPAPPGAPRDA